MPIYKSKNKPKLSKFNRFKAFKNNPPVIPRLKNIPHLSPFLYSNLIASNLGSFFFKKKNMGIEKLKLKVKKRTIKNRKILV